FNVTGRFVVHGVTYPGGTGNQLPVFQQNVPSFWASFEQQCQGSTDGLRGEIRFNADVPLILTSPRTLVASEGQAVTFQVRGLARPGASVSLVASRLPAGSSFHDLGSGTGTFSWVPGFAQQGSHPVVVLAFD